MGLTKELEEFCYKYDAYVQPSRLNHRRAKTAPIVDWNQNPDSYHQTFQYTDVPCVEIRMPEDRFRALMEHDQWLEQESRHGDGWIGSGAVRLVRKYERECRLRQEHEALRKAWNQYQLLLKMVDSGG